jgi:hypothetical protein
MNTFEKALEWFRVHQPRLAQEIDSKRHLLQDFCFLRTWSQLSQKRNDAVMLDQASLPWFAELNRGLRDELDEAGFRARIVESVALLDTLAREIVMRALQRCPQVDASRVLALLNGPAAAGAAPLLFEDAA